MKSQTSLTARNCRLQEWSQMVHSCNNRPIGMSETSGACPRQKSINWGCGQFLDLMSKDVRRKK